MKRVPNGPKLVSFQARMILGPPRSFDDSRLFGAHSGLVGPIGPFTKILVAIHLGGWNMYVSSVTRCSFVLDQKRFLQRFRRSVPVWVALVTFG